MPHSSSAMYERNGRECNNNKSNLHTNSHSQTKAFLSKDSVARRQYLSRNEGWNGPEISDFEISKLGSESEILKVRSYVRDIFKILTLI